MTCQIPLTNLTAAGGCGCKADPALLEGVLASSRPKVKRDQRVILGFETADDCAVYAMGEGEDHLLFSTDFFTPLVDDPALFGRIAAANALSDIYAMGGKPMIANAVLGFSSDNLKQEALQEMIQAGSETVSECGCALVGGHTIVNEQPFYGFSIIGSVAPENLKSNGGAKAGDLLFMTKPIGSGVCSTALKLGLLSEEMYQEILPYWREVNTIGAELGKEQAVHAMTDITGFGLLGHLHEMAEAAGLQAELDFSAVPVINGAQELLEAVVAPKSGNVRNHASYEGKVDYGSLSREQQLLLCDPQSNGGLLVAVDPAEWEGLSQVVKKGLQRDAWFIGRMSERSEGAPSVLVKGE